MKRRMLHSVAFCQILFYQVLWPIWKKWTVFLPYPRAGFSNATSKFLDYKTYWMIYKLLLIFRYQFLAVASDSKTKEEAANMTTGKRVTVSANFRFTLDKPVKKWFIVWLVVQYWRKCFTNCHSWHFTCPVVHLDFRFLILIMFR